MSPVGCHINAAPVVISTQSAILSADCGACRMKPSIAFEHHRDTIRSIVGAHRASNARVFGSVARHEDRDDSDLDILVDIHEDTSLFDIGLIRQEIANIVGVPVDILTSEVLTGDFGAKVLADAQPV